MVRSPAVSWLFFKARAKCPYLSHTGRSAAAEEKRLTGRGPEGCVENGPSAALLVGYVPHQLTFCIDLGLLDEPSNWCGMRPPRALPPAHFERNDVTIICEMVH
jgi:hypothetical protein